MSQYEPLHQSRTDAAKRPARPPRPEFFMPAMPPLGLIHMLETKWWEYQRRRQFRQRFLPLLDHDDPMLEDLAHDDHLLEDLTHFRDDVRWASRLPLKEDAEQALEQRRAVRKAAQQQHQG